MPKHSERDGLRPRRRLNIQRRRRLQRPNENSRRLAGKRSSRHEEAVGTEKGGSCESEASRRKPTALAQPLLIALPCASGGRGLLHAADLFQFLNQRRHWRPHGPPECNGFLSQRLGLIELAAPRQRERQIYASLRTAPVVVRRGEVGNGYRLAEQRHGSGGA